jgi:regulation of enolase protein 1 (concanavalin A-like superfamily)
MEDFETNDFKKLPWEHEGDIDWTTTSWEKHWGNYSAQAGSIDHDESTTLKVTVNCAAGDITFYCKIYSEVGCDYLTFYIDGVEKDTWSGEEDWAEVSFPVTAGTRTFEWTYSKDGSVSEGDDTAWIDDIVFPGDSGPEPPTPPPPASEWANQDIGWPGATGSARYDSATEAWTIQGDGRDIWDQSDAFHYVYKPLSGDGEIIKRVVSVEYTDPWAKAGVMIRESLSASSKHAHLIIAPSYGCRFQLRRITGSGSESDTPVTNLQHIRPPHWVRLVRRGNQFRAYHSNDGRNWEELLWGPQTVVMRNDVYIGMVVTSHADGVLCTAVFDN